MLAVAVLAGCGASSAGEPAWQPNPPSSTVTAAGGNVRVDLIRTGGFAGLKSRSSLDTRSLPQDEARQLSEIVGHLDLEALARTARSHPQPDRFQYDLSIVRGEQHVRVLLDDTGITTELRPLIQLLEQRAQPG